MSRALGVPLPPHPSLLLLLLQVPLQDLLLVGDDASDAVDEVALVVGDEADEDLLLRGVQQHEHAHLTRGLVGKVHAAGLAGTGLASRAALGMGAPPPRRRPHRPPPVQNRCVPTAVLTTPSLLPRRHTETEAQRLLSVAWQVLCRRAQDAEPPAVGSTTNARGASTHSAPETEPGVQAAGPARLRHQHRGSAPRSEPRVLTAALPTHGRQGRGLLAPPPLQGWATVPVTGQPSGTESCGSPGPALCAPLWAGLQGL